jgi:hypothetical protein
MRAILLLLTIVFSQLTIASCPDKINIEVSNIKLNSDSTIYAEVPESHIEQASHMSQNAIAYVQSQQGQKINFEFDRQSMSGGDCIYGPKFISPTGMSPMEIREYYSTYAIWSKTKFQIYSLKNESNILFVKEQDVPNQGAIITPFEIEEESEEDEREVSLPLATFQIKFN